MSAERVGRNDPCPCKSGKKYKKCCAKIDRALRDAEQARDDVEILVHEGTTPLEFWDALFVAGFARRDALAWWLAHPDGPWRARFDDLSDYLRRANAGEVELPGDGFAPGRFRVDEPDVHLIAARGLENPGLSRVRCARITMRRSCSDDRPPDDRGLWRLWDLSFHELIKDEIKTAPRFEQLGLSWTERARRDAPTRQRT